MRKLFFALSIFLSTTLSSFAQNDIDKAEIELYQSMFGMEKKTVFADYITVQDQDKEVFWKLYDEYEEARVKIASERIDLLYKYVDRNTLASNDEIKEAMSTILKQNKSLAALKDKYYKKISKEINPRTASQFYHLENYFQSVLSIMVIEQLPFIKTKQLKQ